MPVQKPIEKIIEKSFCGIPIASKLTFKTMSRSATFHVFSPSLSLPVRSPVCQSLRTRKSTTSNMLPKTTRPTPVAQNPPGTRDFFFRDQFAHCPWVHVSQDGEQCENGNRVFCLPYGLLAAVLLLAVLMALPHLLLCLPHFQIDFPTE